ncbi:6-phosphogluconolactonase [Paenibacillus sp. TRM 82003]|uniref:6-phosphogluconolactonase n=1 Tax=Kineococcus sp. TRM81007 TaxID=2925831 RepID=UPI001F599747|nr:6-phosphogluconolactonase [Kineococcus sp. TRM81007]MCI2237632.1 6-phosphogluconolactonase [Kineococcus sp. TRM81007]MCI3921649.1 6-phosphogluconolactonase [Paenibacillus sp. TRM 82003]
MSAHPLVVVHPTPEVLAHAAAGRLLAAVTDALAQRGVAHVSLTGGTIGGKTLEAVAASPARDAVDWRRVHLWWSDERFLPAGDPDRNATQARRALLDALDLDAATVHEPPASDGPDGDDPDAAAARYAAELAAAAGGAEVPAFDVLLLGMGPDGHVASLFPHHPGLARDESSVIGVRESPKPPPVRLSFTFGALARARQVWVIASGTEKAGAVARGVAGGDVSATPAAGVRGSESTLWLVDAAAAAELPG